MKIKREDENRIKEFIKNLENPKDNLVTLLHYAQEIFGYLPDKVVNFLSKEIGVEKEKLEIIVEGNNYFRKIKEAKFPILICKGNRCEKKNPEKVVNLIKELLGIEVGEHTLDGLFSLKEMPCIGACKLAPVFTIEKKVYGEKDLENIKEILESYRKIV